MQTVRHGPEPDQDADLYLPDGPGPHRAIVLFHGGSFEAAYGRGMLAPAAEDLRGRGFVVLNGTYRRLGSGGGWPQTFDDARATLALLRGREDVSDVTVLGFSAGFPAAVHAVRHAAPEDRVSGLVGLAGVTRLAALARERGIGGNVWRLLGDPAAVPEVYAACDPLAALPLTVPAVVVHGEVDAVLPLAEGRAWVQAAGGEVELWEVPGAGHFEVHHPGSLGWEAVLSWLERPAPAAARRPRRR